MSQKKNIAKVLVLRWMQTFLKLCLWK